MRIDLAPAKPNASLADIKPRLLALAEVAFAELGFHGASLSSIARSAGLSNPGLLHHFPSKGALYVAVLDRINRDFLERANAALPATITGEMRLDAWIRLEAQWGVDRPQAVRLVLRELLDNVGRVSSADVLPMTELVDTMKREFSELQAQGVLPRGSPLALVTQVLGTLAYALVVRPTFARMQPDDPVLSDDLSWSTAVADALRASLSRARRVR